MDMVLLDWTRMGRLYCLAGIVDPRGSCRVVRPLLAKHRNAVVRNTGWSPYLMDGYTRWQIFELVDPVPARPEPPHVEDLWVRSLRPRKVAAAPAERRAILDATTARPEEPLFGAPLTATRSAAFLASGAGARSLTTLIVRSTQIAFHASRRDGATDVRVTLPLAGLGERSLPVKDHHFLARAEQTRSSLEAQLKSMDAMVRDMGADVAVRLGLSRAFPNAAEGQAVCWLMADGFFSLSNPQS